MKCYLNNFLMILKSISLQNLHGLLFNGQIYLILSLFILYKYSACSLDSIWLYRDNRNSVLPGFLDISGPKIFISNLLFFSIFHMLSITLRMFFSTHWFDVLYCFAISVYNILVIGRYVDLLSCINCMLDTM